MNTLDRRNFNYRMYECRNENWYTHRAVIIDVPRSVDLAIESSTMSLLEYGKAYANEKCPKNERGNITVILCYPGQKLAADNPNEICAVRARCYSEGQQVVWREYENRPLIEKNNRIREQQAALQEKEMKEKAMREEQVKIAKANQKREERKRIIENFVAKYGVTAFPNHKEFTSNPFIYEGKTVAFITKFQIMTSANEAIFGTGDLILNVSEIPKGLFKLESDVSIAGKVIGNKEVKLPFPIGARLVPHLKFVGAEFCKEKNCGEWYNQ
jgi:hypothetical protein